jgi:hypothetical protein
MSSPWANLHRCSVDSSFACGSNRERGQASAHSRGHPIRGQHVVSRAAHDSGPRNGQERPYFRRFHHAGAEIYALSPAKKLSPDLGLHAQKIGVDEVFGMDSHHRQELWSLILNSAARFLR